MKSMLVIGCGDFGHHLTRHLIEMENEVLVVDKGEENLEDLEDYVSGRIVADCTSKSALQQLGVENFDMCFVCIDTDFKSNLIIVSHLRELGAKYIVSETDDEMLEKLLLNNGANEVIHPNSDSALRAAVKYSNEHIFDYLQLRGGYSVYEITPIEEWISKKIIDTDMRKKYNINIIGIMKENGETSMIPDPSTVIERTDRLFIVAHETTIHTLIRKMGD